MTSTCSMVAAWMFVAASAIAVHGADVPASQDPQLTALEAYAQTAQRQWNVPGFAIAVVKDDRVVYAKGFGVKRAGGSDPVDADTVFEIGSTSKAFTAALVAMQVDDGKFGWGDRVIDHLPSFEMHDPWVTRELQVADLMAQHSGMPPYAGDAMAVLGFPADYIVSKMKLIQPVTSFRTDFGYVNNLFLVAADLAQATSGQTWADGLRARVFDPLGMRSSSSGQKDFAAAANAAAPHKLVGGTVTAFAADAPQVAWAYTYGPAGGVNSSVRDMAQWLRMLLGGGTFEGKRIVGADNLDAVMSPRTVIRFPKSGPLANTPFVRFPTFYCNGWISSAAHPSTLVWHNGDNNFMHAAIGVIRDANTGIVVLTNLGGSSLADALLWRWFDLVGGNPETDWSTLFHDTWSEGQTAARAPFAAAVADAAPAQALSRYAGTFRNPVYGDVAIAADGPQLRLVAGPAKITMALVHRTRDTFVLSQPDLDAFLGDSGWATFAFGGDGAVTSVTLSEFGDVDGGRFVAVPKS
jgi:CubicO group peptidase (beta-lactamase class C family)